MSHCGHASRFRGLQDTTICVVVGLQVASAGACGKALQRSGLTTDENIGIHLNHHVGYHLDVHRMTLKNLLARSMASSLGVQGVVGRGLDRRRDVLAALLQKPGTVYDSEKTGLC